jgi:NAD(P)-dependent dehydrogenase (short-subunit alcohol dehydrogenase family)
MDIAGSVVVITGGGGGIGEAMALAFAEAGAAHVAVVDRDVAAARRVASAISGTPYGIDVSDAAQVMGMVDDVIEAQGRIDLLCSNAGFMTGKGLDADLDAWRTTYDVHVLAHVYAARAVLPSMLARGSGHLLSTASAAGLLTSPGDAPYTASKHAAVGLAEWLAITYGQHGIGVSVVCPMGVDTPLLSGWMASDEVNARSVTSAGDLMSPADVAAAVLEGVRSDTFLILPHAQVSTYWQKKAADPQRWIAGVRRSKER